MRKGEAVPAVGQDVIDGWETLKAKVKSNLKSLDFSNHDFDIKIRNCEAGIDVM